MFPIENKLAIMNNIEKIILNLISEKSLLACEVRDYLVQNGHSKFQIQKAIFNLWDQGWLNVGLDQKLSPVNYKD